MKRKQIYIQQEQETALKELAARRGVPEALLIREAVARYIAEQEPAVLERIEDHPLWALRNLAYDFDGPTDGALNHDFYLYGAPKKSNAPKKRK
jgi:hypothetical protein